MLWWRGCAVRISTAAGEPDAPDWAAVGSVLGILGAYLFRWSSAIAGHTQSFLQILVMLLMSYVGLVVGANKGDLLNLAGFRGVLRRREAR